MALDFDHGAIQWLTTDAVGTTYTVSGLSFQPKAIRFYCVGIQSATNANANVDRSVSVGFAVSTTERRCVAGADLAAGTSSNCGSMFRNDCCVVATNGSGTSSGQLDVSAINSDGFVVRVDVQQSNQDHTVFWEAWGGSDITAAMVGDIAEPAATGNVDYTVTGFTASGTDQVVLFAGCQTTAAVNVGSATDSGVCVGFASGGDTADNVVVLGNADDASTTMDTDGYCKTGECLALCVVGGGTANARAQLTQFGTDNFRLNWLARATTDRRYIFMAIKGGSWKAGSYTIDGSSASATATVSGLSFAPKGITLIGRMTAEQTAGSTSAQDRLGFGTGTSASSRRSMGVLDENGTANTEIDLTIQYDQVLSFPSTTGTLQSAYDINAMNSDGFQIIVDTAGGVASEWQGYLAFGDAAAGTSPITGTSSPAFSNSGTLTGKGALAGTSSPTFSEAATLRGKGALTGTSSPAFSNTGTLRLQPSQITGTSSPAFSNSGTLTGKGALAGTSSPAFSNTGALTADAAITGTSAPAFTNTGVLRGKGALAGTSSPTFSEVAVLRGKGALAGTSSPAFSESAALRGKGALAGTSAVAFLNSGELSEVAAGAMAGSVQIDFSNTGVLTGRGALAGVAQLVFTETATITGIVPPQPTPPGATKRQHRRFKQNAEVVLLGLPVVTGTSLEVRISGTAEGYVRDVGGLRAASSMFGASAAATIQLVNSHTASTSAGVFSFPKSAVVRVEFGVVTSTEVGIAAAQADSSAAPIVRRRGVAQAGVARPDAVSNPSDREIALLALQVIRDRRRRRGRRLTT